MVCLESRLTKDVWQNFFTIFKTFEKYTVILSLDRLLLLHLSSGAVTRKLITSESFYNLKRLSNYFNKSVESQKWFSAVIFCWIF